MDNYVVDGDKIRKDSAFGSVVYTIDGNNVREGSAFGKIIYTIDGDKIRKGGAFGSVVYTIDGNNIREGGAFGKILYTIDGNNIKKSVGEREQHQKSVGGTRKGTGSVGGGAVGVLLLLILGIIIGPFLTFRVLPTWGKFCLLVNIFTPVGFIIGMLVTKRKAENEDEEAVNEQKSRRKTSSIFLIIGFVIGYIVYSVMIWEEFAGNEENDFVFANFKPALLVFTIISVFFTLISIINLFSDKSNWNGAKKIKLVLSLFLCCSVLAFSIVGTAIGDASVNSKKSEYYKEIEESKKVVMGDLVSCNTYDTYVALKFELTNNTDATVYSLKRMSITVRDTTQIVASGVFNDYTLSYGGLRSGATTTIELRFYFSPGQEGAATRSYWQSAKEITVTITSDIRW